MPNTFYGNNFAVKLTGYINALVDGMYTFVLGSDDGAYLYLTDSTGTTEIVNNQAQHGIGVVRYVEINLTTGTYFANIEYYNHGGDRGLYLWWTTPGMRALLTLYGGGGGSAKKERPGSRRRWILNIYIYIYFKTPHLLLVI
jgi:hypothetical protein